MARWPLLSSAGEIRAMGILALAAFAGILWIARPVAIGLLLGTLIAFTLQPLYQRLRMSWGRPLLASLACVGLVSVAFVGTLGGFGYLLVVRGVAIVQALILALEPGRPARLSAERLSRVLKPLHLEAADVITRLQGAAGGLAARLANLAATVVTFMLAGLLTLFFAVLTIHFILRHWDRVTRRAEAVLPLQRRHTHALLGQFRSVGRSVLLGTVVTGLAQGLLAGFGYWIAGIRDAGFFGALTALTSLVPGVGTMLVWVPAGIYLILTGHLAAGVLELIYGGLVVVGLSDYAIRPRLVGGHKDTPSLLTFIALFGGVETFGLIGLILGPIIMESSLAVLRIYEQDRLGSGP
jgi:predicted PurR-regulated permease PerM